MLLFIESAVIPLALAMGRMSTMMMCNVCALYIKSKAVAKHIAVCYN